MTEPFDKHYWEKHWQEAGERGGDRGLLANPHLAREVGDLEPGSALDAGCGEGIEAIWLAANGWDVTAADISAAALERARRRAAGGERAADIEWVEADLGVWEPGRRFGLVMTNYAHPDIPQLAFYERIADWVAPAGTLLIVGHLHSRHHSGEHRGDQQQPPDDVSVTAESITGLLNPETWNVITADEISRTLRAGTGRTLELHDVVVRAERRTESARSAS